MPSPSLFLWDSSFEGKTLVAIIGRLLISVSINSPSVFRTLYMA